MELVSATRKAIDSGPGAADPAVREAAEALAVMLSLFAPYTAEECWEALGGPAGPVGIPSVARAAWPAADPALLVQETVTCVVQVNGKVRDRLEVSPDITRGRAARPGASRPGGDPRAGRAGDQAGGRPPAEAGEHRRRVTVRGDVRSLQPALSRTARASSHGGSGGRPPGIRRV